VRVQTAEGVLGWCPTHRKLEACHADGRLACSEAWHDQLKLESMARIEKHRQNPEPLLEQIRDDIREIRGIQEENVTTDPRPAPPPPPPRPTRVGGSPRDMPPRVPERRGVAL
jgi:hypothetical protein